MSRKTRKSPGVAGIALAAMVIGTAFVLATVFFTGESTPYRTTPELEVGDYLGNANSLRGNVYRIEGEVLNSLAWSPKSGRLIAISVREGQDVLPVLVTTDFNKVNIQKGQRFVFLLEVDDQGILKTRDLTKA